MRVPRLTLLGTGTSFGVPQLGCDCAVCRSSDPRDRRGRTAALIESNDQSILVDTPPELRISLLAAGVTRVDAVCYTHEHADHVAGIDDLRIFSLRQKTAVPVYAAARTAAGKGLRTVVIEGGREVGGLCILRGCSPPRPCSTPPKSGTLPNTPDCGA